MNHEIEMRPPQEQISDERVDAKLLKKLTEGRNRFYNYCDGCLNKAAREHERQERMTEYEREYKHSSSKFEELVKDPEWLLMVANMINT